MHCDYYFLQNIKSRRKFLQSILLILCFHVDTWVKAINPFVSWNQWKPWSPEAKLRACRGPNNDAMVIRSGSKQALTCGKRMKIAQQIPRIRRQISFRASSKFGVRKLAFLRTFFSARMEFLIPREAFPGHSARTLLYGTHPSCYKTRIQNVQTTDVKRVALCFVWSSASGLRFDIQMQAKNLNSNHRSPQVSLYLSHFPAWLFQNCVPQ